ncbi:MAG: glycosyltransferase family 2 protein, partial [Gammaproteobacteria bacterium]|nr:glycosyltransferase family 2 protein [Gammaproteobacteria bacterium]
DDGSHDQSTAVAKRYAQSHPDRIRYLEHEDHRNRGKSISRNLGIEHAAGEYLAFLDADDVFLPHKLAHQLAIIHSRPELVMVYGPTLYWYGWSGAKQDLRNDRIQTLGNTTQNVLAPPQLIIQYLNNPGSVPCTCALLVRRIYAKNTGGFDNTIHDLYEDQVFLAKLCLQGPVFIDNECCDKYRQHPDSSSHAAIISGEYHPYLPNPSRLAFLVWLGNYLQDQHVDDRKLWKAYRSARRPYKYPRLSRLLGPLYYISPWLKAWVSHIINRLSSVNR